VDAATAAAASAGVALDAAVADEDGATGVVGFGIAEPPKKAKAEARCPIGS
jgi:hypothetical protein